ncbi:hypothetical protein ACFO3J_35785 [Streptomyces polygonati]|uniref:LigA protein n=1 Tax=Streptomyces polygonati TaxID=1617087 RepID=A0ABV8I077_9ACTN
MLPGIPLFPGVADYPHWAARLDDLGVRHTAQALLPAAAAGAPAAGFKVLDGLWFRGRGLAWQRVDRAYVARWRQGRAAAAEALADRLDAALAADAMCLRRVVLYELAVLLQDKPGPERARTAISLGLAAGEADILAAALGAALPLGGLDREAAEGVQSAWEHGRLRRATALAARLPAAPADPLLAELLAAIAGAAREADALLAEAARRADGGDDAAAARAYLRAARLAADDERALAGLLRTTPDTPAPEVRAEWEGDALRVRWTDWTGWTDDTAPVDHTDLGFHVVRHLADHPEESVRLGSGHGRAGILDTGAVTGTRVRYSVLPIGDGRIAGLPRTSTPLLVAPEVTDLEVTSGRSGVTGTWRAPDTAAAVRVVRLGPRGPADTEADTETETDADTELPCRRDGFEDPATAPGPRAYLIGCDYRAPDGTIVSSPGRWAGAVMEEWPQPVTTLTVLAAGPLGDAVRLDWPAPARGEVRIVPWDDDPPAPGTDLTGELPHLPSPLITDPAESITVAPGAALRIVAVGVLGRHAVAGPSLLVEALPEIGGLRAERLPDDEIRVVLDWPPSAATLMVGREQDGRSDERPLTRSAYLRAGLRLPATGSACAVTVRAVSTPGADLVLGGAARIELPPQVRVDYRLLKPGWRGGARRTVVVRAVLPGSTGPAAPDAAGEPPAAPGCPDFLLVGRPAVPPLHPGQGTAELRLPGARLTSGEPVHIELDLRDRARPYLLRGFLLGAHSADARLDHPTPDTLVVR